MQLAKEITYGQNGQLIQTFLFDETQLEEIDSEKTPKLVEHKKFKSLLSYGRYLDKLKDLYKDSLTELPTITNKK